MAVTVEAVVDIGQRVTDTAATTYARSGVTVVETSIATLTGVRHQRGKAIVAADLGVVECLLDEDMQAVDLLQGATAMASMGWQVSLLVEASRMGEAHKAFRGRPVSLQAWWMDGETVCFGGPEVP